MSLLGNISCSPIINSSSFLDLGGALAAFGLIFAVYQLRNPRWDTVLMIRRAWQRNIFWMFGVLGLLLVLVGVVFRQFADLCLIPPFNNPALFEIFAYIFFILSPLSLMYFSRQRKDLYKESTARKFYEVLISEVSRSDDKWLDAALSLLMFNFDEICRHISTDSRESEASKSGRAIIDVVLSENSVVKALTTKRLDALQHVFLTIEKYKINRNQCDVGIPAIVRNLFLDEESFFYRHLNRDGLALSSNIYETIFESSVILSNFDLFGYPTLGFSAKADSLVATNVFIEALSKAIATYLKTGSVNVRYLNEGLEYLSNLFESMCFKISQEESRGVDTKYKMKDEWWILHTVARFLGHDYPFLVYQDVLSADVTATEKTASEADFFSDSTVNAGIAAILYKSFEQLTYIDKGADIYHTLHELLQGMTYEENYKEGYRAPFEKRIWEQIAKNIIERYYPAVLKTYLTVFGFYLTAHTAEQKAGRRTWVVDQTERLRRLLYVDLKPLIEKGEKMINDELMVSALLPDLMNYKDGKFTYALGFGKGPIEVIDEPLAGSKSALDGVDLDSKSLL